MMTEGNSTADESTQELQYVQYEIEKEPEYLPAIRALIAKDLSEPYSIYVYRYFLNQWGDLCFMTFSPPNPSSPPTLIGTVLSKLEKHRSGTYRGYIAMLAVSSDYRKRGIATSLVTRAIDAMAARGAEEIVLETETSNIASLKLYERLGFLRSKRLHRYYLNGNSALRLVLFLKKGCGQARVEPGYGQAGGEEEALMAGGGMYG